MFIHHCGSTPKYFPKASAVGAVIARNDFTSSLTCRGLNPQSLASRYWLRPIGSRKSCRRISPGCTGVDDFTVRGIFDSLDVRRANLASLGSMVVDDLDIVRVSVDPSKADAPLVVDANAVLPCSAAFQRFQSIARRNREIAQPCDGRQLRELSRRSAANRGRKSPRRSAAVKVLGVGTAKARDHPS